MRTGVRGEDLVRLDIVIAHPARRLSGRAVAVIAVLLIAFGVLMATAQSASAHDQLIQTDCTLVGGDSGGPLFDMQGKLIGIHSRISGPITTNIHVPVDTYRESWEKLAAAEEWGNGPFFGGGGPKQAGVYMGVLLDFESKAGKITLIAPNSPAEKAGLKVDDVLTELDGKKVSSQAEVNTILLNKKANDEVSVLILRGEARMTLRLKLERRPDNL